MEEKEAGRSEWWWQLSLTFEIHFAQSLLSSSDWDKRIKKDAIPSEMKLACWSILPVQFDCQIDFLLQLIPFHMVTKTKSKSLFPPRRSSSHAPSPIYLTSIFRFTCMTRDIHRHPNSILSRQLLLLPEGKPKTLKYSRSSAHFPTILRFLEDGKEALFCCDEIQRGRVAIHEVVVRYLASSRLSRSFYSLSSRHDITVCRISIFSCAPIVISGITRMVSFSPLTHVDSLPYFLFWNQILLRRVISTVDSMSGTSTLKPKYDKTMKNLSIFHQFVQIHVAYQQEIVCPDNGKKIHFQVGETPLAILPYLSLFQSSHHSSIISFVFALRTSWYLLTFDGSLFVLWIREYEYRTTRGLLGPSKMSAWPPHPCSKVVLLQSISPVSFAVSKESEALASSSPLRSCGVRPQVLLGGENQVRQVKI